MPNEVTPYSKLSPEERERIPATWKLDGGTTDWETVARDNYCTAEHVRVVFENGHVQDRMNLKWTPGAFVVVFRFNPERGNRVEFLLQVENRVLLRDKDGIQGNVDIRNIPQGLIKVAEGEEPIDAAIREVKEETGFDQMRIVYLRSLLFDAANSETPMPFYLAEVPYLPHALLEQNLDLGENIKKVSESDWFGADEVTELELQCAKSLAGISIAKEALPLWDKPETTPTSLNSSYENLTLGLI